MICYKDKTFCKAICECVSCGRNWLLLDKEDYRAWSTSLGLRGGPVALADLSGSCKSFTGVAT